MFWYSFLFGIFITLPHTHKNHFYPVFKNFFLNKSKTIDHHGKKRWSHLRSILNSNNCYNMALDQSMPIIPNPHLKLHWIITDVLFYIQINRIRRKQKCFKSLFYFHSLPQVHTTYNIQHTNRAQQTRKENYQCTQAHLTHNLINWWLMWKFVKSWTERHTTRTADTQIHF
jgi:hypothetical protein